MKIIKTANGNEIKLSKSEWESIGKTAGWMKSSITFDTLQRRWDNMTPEEDDSCYMCGGYGGEGWYENEGLICQECGEKKQEEESIMDKLRAKGYYVNKDEYEGKDMYFIEIRDGDDVIDDMRADSIEDLDTLSKELKDLKGVK